MRYIGMAAAVIMAAASALPAMAQTTGTTMTTTTTPGVVVTPGQAPTTTNSTVYGNPQIGMCGEGHPSACPPGVNPLTQPHTNSTGG
jgi:hypothetical protein